MCNASRTRWTRDCRQPVCCAAKEAVLNPDPSDISRAAQRALVLYLPAMLLLGGAVFMGTITRDGDIYFHIVAGRWIAEHLQFIHHDFFSYTANGAKWDDPEWLSEVLAAFAYRLGGWSAVAVLFASAAAFSLLLVSRQLMKSLAPLPALIVMQFVLAMIASNLSSRPYVLALPLLAVWTDGLLTARAEGRSPTLWLLPLMLLWSNLHGSFLFGIALIVPFAAEAFFAEGAARWRTAQSWTAFGAGSVVAATINPNGVYGIIDPILFTMKPILGSIGDWQGSFFTQIGAFEVTLLAVFALALSRPVRIPFFPAPAARLLVHMTLSHRRHINVFAIVAPMILAEPISLALGRDKTQSIQVPRVETIATLVAAIATVVIVSVRLLVPNVLEESMVSPAKALAHVPSAIANQPVFNGDSSGGFLIWHGIRPFIDTRVEVFGDIFPDYYTRIFAPDRAWLAKTLAKHRVAWTIFPPESAVNSTLEDLHGWRKLYADKFAVIFVRSDLPVSGDAENSAYATARASQLSSRRPSRDDVLASRAAR